jgi:uncharacterized membrane protein
METMSQTRLRAWMAIVIWVVAGIGFCLAFFMRGGPREFAADSGRHVAAAAAMAFGFLAWWAALFRTRARAGEVAVDERDLQVVARAGQTTLIVVLVAIFAFTIGLWTAFEGDGSVPVGWMWFLAYGSVILASITHGVVVLTLDGKAGGNG